MMKTFLEAFGGTNVRLNVRIRNVSYSNGFIFRGLLG
jgi:hypothetical protein